MVEGARLESVYTVKNYVVIMSGAAARTLKKSKKRIKKYNKKGNIGHV